MASVKFVFRTQQKDKDGLCPLYIRLIQNRQSKFISTGVKALPSQWDEKNHKLKKNFKNSTRVNAMLAKKIADAAGTIADTERKHKTVSARRLKEAVKGKDCLPFFKYSEEKLEKLKSNYSVNTYDVYRSQLKKFKEYVNDDNLMFDDITVGLLQDYMLYRNQKFGNNKTTQKLSMIVLSMMFKNAQKEGLIEETLYPFKNLELQVEPSKRQFLTEAQFNQLREAKFTTKSKAELYRDLFMFSVSAGGLRFSDVVTLTWDNFNEQEQIIRKEIEKTGRIHAFKIGKTALEIIEKYRTLGKSKGNFIFPAIKNADFHLLSEEKRNSLVGSCNTICGKHLRELGKKLKFPFSLTFHLSRHTFATMALNKGMRIEYVSKLLDHRNISTTQIYAKIVNDELNKAVDAYVI